jgi:predicted ATP-dependent protease
MIPHQNVTNLTLDDEVIEAVKAGKFHIWPVATVDQGIEILTGLPAGERGPDGSFPPGTIHYLVSKRLAEYTDTLIKMGKSAEEHAGSERKEVVT